MGHWYVSWKGKHYKHLKGSDTNAGEMPIPKETRREGTDWKVYVCCFILVWRDGTYLFTCLDSSTYENLLANALSLSTTQSADIDDELFMDDPVHSSFKSPIKTYVHVYRGGFCGRGNTTASYNELNRYVSIEKVGLWWNLLFILCVMVCRLQSRVHRSLVYLLVQRLLLEHKSVTTRLLANTPRLMKDLPWRSLVLAHIVSLERTLRLLIPSSWTTWLLATSKVYIQERWV